MIYTRIKQIRELLNLTQSEFATKTGVARSAISEFENGTREPSKSFLLAIKDLGISIDWFLTGEGDIFFNPSKQDCLLLCEDGTSKSKQDCLNKEENKQETLLVGMQNSHSEKQENLPIVKNQNDSLKQSVSNSIESLALESTAPRFAELEEKISTQNEKLNNLQAQIDELKGAVEKKQIEEVRESAPTYGIEEPSEPEETEDLPLAENLAAGIPIEAFDSGDIYPVPKKFLKRGKKYCVAKIRGTSMTEAGIADGAYVLLEYTDTALPGEIMVVKYGDQTTLKRLSQKEDGAWELLYEDGSQAKIELKDGDWEVKGHYVRVV